MKPQIQLENGKAYILTEIIAKPSTIKTTIDIEEIIIRNRKTLAHIVKCRYEQCCISLKNGVVTKIHTDGIEYIDDHNMSRFFNLRSQETMIELYNMLSDDSRRIVLDKSMIYQLIKSFPFFNDGIIHEGDKEMLMTYILEEASRLMMLME